MPRFFFNIHDGTDMPDQEGTVLPDLAAACIGAIQMAGAVLADSACADWTGKQWSMDVQDEGGSTLLTLQFSATPHAGSGV